ncbi:ABC transporter ATP-binding protein [Novosphingobium aerophilum]|uniref:ABC transporter ATP-binding protein n=1 Tax=Novosphingobium TaxID=165696 RepID=UPI002D77C477|nr:ABC transporter ATP-binding protein [Novosphingobium sp. RL4]WRT96072.1 ABC transporter ATP-binding protein [Novosphingobium sp. RL4]
MIPAHPAPPARTQGARGHVVVEGLRIVAGPPGNEHAIVNDVSFSVAPGRTLALIGESGSGKSTIALALAGFARPGARIAGGIVSLAGDRIDLMDDRALRAVRGRRVAYVAQSAAAAFNPSRTIMAQVIEPLLVHRLAPRAEAILRAQRIFASLSLPDPETIGQRYPHQLSGGQLQRLMAAMALITGPELLIFDEPTTALDVTTQVEVLKAFKAAIAQSGATAIYVCHDLPVVAQMADDVLVLQHGRTKEAGSLAAVFGTPGDPYTRALLAAADHGHCPPANASAGGQPSRPSPAQGRPLLRVEGLAAGYGRVRNGRPEVPILEDISLECRRGETVGVIGESGSGKSTLAKVVAGLVPRASGTVRIDDTPLPAGLGERSREHFRRVQLVFQHAETALNPAKTVGAILARPLALHHGIHGRAADRRVAELLDLIQLPAETATRNVRALSGGQKQRVNLARALAAEPDLLICDEVTSALDTIVGQAILELIDGLRRELGIAVMFISHDISTVRAFCDRILVLYGGRAVETASGSAFARGPHHPYTDLLLSSVPRMEPGWLDAGAMRARGAGFPSDLAICRFEPRCGVTIRGRCNCEPPPLRRQGEQAWLCHHPAEVLAAE